MELAVQAPLNLCRGRGYTAVHTFRVSHTPSSGSLGGLTDTDTAPQNSLWSAKLAHISIPPISPVNLCSLNVCVSVCISMLHVYSVSGLKPGVPALVLKPAHSRGGLCKAVGGGADYG